MEDDDRDEPRRLAAALSEPEALEDPSVDQLNRTMFGMPNLRGSLAPQSEPDSPERPLGGPGAYRFARPASPSEGKRSDASLRLPSLGAPPKPDLSALSPAGSPPTPQPHEAALDVPPPASVMSKQTSALLEVLLALEDVEGWQVNAWEDDLVPSSQAMTRHDEPGDVRSPQDPYAPLSEVELFGSTFLGPVARSSAALSPSSSAASSPSTRASSHASSHEAPTPGPGSPAAAHELDFEESAFDAKRTTHLPKPHSTSPGLDEVTSVDSTRYYLVSERDGVERRVLLDASLVTLVAQLIFEREV